MNFSRLFSSRIEPNPVADELRAQLEAERARNDELVRTIVELKRDGFQPPPTQAPMTEEGYGLPSEVMHAIETRAATRHAREKLMQYARGALRAAEPGEVADRIMQGEQDFSWG